MTEQIQSVASIDDFEANRAKTKKALPALLIVFTLGTLMIQAFNLVFQNIGDSLGMSSSASLISTLPGIVLGVVCMLYGTLCDFISPKRMTLFGVVALVAGSFLGFFGSFNFWVVLIARMIQVAGAQVAGSVFLVMTVKYLGLSLFGVGEWVGGWWCWSGSLGVWIPRRCSPPPCNCLTRGGCRAWSSVTRRTADGNCISRSGSRRVRGSPARNRGAARPRVRCMTRGSACGGI